MRRISGVRWSATVCFSKRMVRHNFHGDHQGVHMRGVPAEKLKTPQAA